MSSFRLKISAGKQYSVSIIKRGTRASRMLHLP
jgi:hypothetical protein